MDNVKWSKLARECGLIGKSVTRTDIDMIFTKSKAKGARRLAFQDFVNALTAVAAKTKHETLEDLVMAINHAGAGLEGPGVAGGTKIKSKVTKVALNHVDRLTDHTQYTGAHKNRFDAEGRGKGLDGRDYNNGIVPEPAGKVAYMTPPPPRSATTGMVGDSGTQPTLSYGSTAGMQAPRSGRRQSKSGVGRMTCPTCAFPWNRPAHAADKTICPKCQSRLPAVAPAPRKSDMAGFDGGPGPLSQRRGSRRASGAAQNGYGAYGQAAMAAPRPRRKSKALGGVGRMSCPTCAFSWNRPAHAAHKTICPKCQSPLPGVAPPARKTEMQFDAYSGGAPANWRRGSRSQARNGKQAGGGSIFDRLTDSSQYTGAHKQRFDSSGRGRGMAGRDAASGVAYGSRKVGNIQQAGFLRPGI
jgi:ssDNA-binding Zn-finger/Zn-ribbon topoisomerase 1